MNDPGLLELAHQLMQMRDLPLDRIREPCEWCTAESQCVFHRQFHREREDARV